MHGRRSSRRRGGTTHRWVPSPERCGTRRTALWGPALGVIRGESPDGQPAEQHDAASYRENLHKEAAFLRQLQGDDGLRIGCVDGGALARGIGSVSHFGSHGDSLGGFGGGIGIDHHTPAAA